MAMIIVDGTKEFSPSSLTWGLQDVSASDSGRVEDGNDTMYKNRTSQKVKLEIAFTGPDVAETSRILKAFNPEYISVKYPDSMEGTDLTKEFYVGDRTAMHKIWHVNNKRYSSVSFDIIER